MFRALATVALVLSLVAPLAGAGEPTVPPDPIAGDDVIADHADETIVGGRGLDDPLDLIPDASRFRRYSLGTDRWEVWACNTDGDPNLTLSDLQDTADNYNTSVAEWFDWASDGQYIPVFSVGGLSDGGDPGNGRFQCDEDIKAQSRSRVDVHGVLVVSNHSYSSGGVSDPGVASAGTFPDNDRFMWLDYAQSWSFFFGFLQVHELGHTLGWPHSSGEIPFDDGFDRGNPTDVMGCCPMAAGAMGTHVLNRYAAGWIPKNKVRVVGNKAKTVDIGPVESDGAQMIVIPSGQDHRYTVLGVRAWDDAGHDNMASLAMEGVEVYELDQSDFEYLGQLFTRWSLGRRTRPVPSPEFVDTNEDGTRDTWTTPHIHGVGDVFQVANRTIEIVRQNDDGSYRVKVSRAGTCGGKFPTLIGTSIDDEIEGTDGADVIAGLEDRDRIDGMGGDDIICGNDAVDFLTGGGGNDTLYGGSGRDRLKGQDGNDLLFGNTGDDRLAGHRGKDVLNGGQGEDRGVGGAGPDSCISIEIERSC